MPERLTEKLTIRLTRSDVAGMGKRNRAAFARGAIRHALQLENLTAKTGNIKVN